MKIYSSMPIEEFLDDVRFQAAQSGAPPALIDKLDECLSFSRQEAEIEKLGDEISEKEKAFDDLRDELRTLYEAIIAHNESELMADVPDDKLMGVKHPAMVAAENALSRHDT
jgi:uncharacterized coiled-coil protein SlyX